MNPLDHSSAAELFGVEALGDPKALRKAYARLIRQFTPETHPDAFAHIRRLYEEARQDLGQELRLMTARPEGSAARGAASPHHDWMSWQKAALESGCSQALAHLEAQVLAGADHELIRRWVSLLGARPSVVARDALVEAWPRIPTQLQASLVTELLAAHAELGRVDLWCACFDTGSQPGERALLRMARLDGAGDAQAAAEVFATSWVDLRTMGEDLRVELMELLVCARLLLWLSSGQLAALEDWLMAVDVGVSESLVERLYERIACARLLRAARADPAVPADLVDVLWAASQLDSAQAALLLQDVRAAFEAAGVAALAAHLTNHHPVLMRMVDQLLDRASHRYAWVRLWAQRGAPVSLFAGATGPLAPALVRLDGELEGEAAAQPPTWTRQGLVRAALSVAGLLGLLLTGSALAGWSTEGRALGEAFVSVASLLGLLSLPVLWTLVGATRTRLRHEQDASFDPVAQWRRQLMVAAEADMGRGGLWVHELATRLHSGRAQVVAAFLDSLMTDRTADIRSVTDAHCGRAAWGHAAGSARAGTDAGGDP